MTTIHNIVGLRRLFGNRFEFWRAHTSHRGRSYICRGWQDAGHPTRFTAPTAQALAEALVAAGYEPKP